MNHRSIAFGCHPVQPIDKKKLTEFISSLDPSFPEPLHKRSYFLSFEEIANKFFSYGLISYAINENSDLIGVAVVYVDSEKFDRAYETYIGVLPEYQNCGVAKKLSELEFKMCLDRKATGIMTNCDPRNNSKIALNLKLGYQLVTKSEEIAKLEEINIKWRGKAFFIKNLKEIK